MSIYIKASHPSSPLASIRTSPVLSQSSLVRTVFTPVTSYEWKTVIQNKVVFLLPRWYWRSQESYHSKARRWITLPSNVCPRTERHDTPAGMSCSTPVCSTRSCPLHSIHSSHGIGQFRTLSPYTLSSQRGYSTSFSWSNRVTIPFHMS